MAEPSDPAVWPAGLPGVVEFPSGRRVRGRRISTQAPLAGGVSRDTPGTKFHPASQQLQPDPTFGLYLGIDPDVPWNSRTLAWRDFWVPADTADAVAAISDAWQRAGLERVEVACRGGKGRTGTALAAMAVLDELSPADAVAYVRNAYDRRAVETPWQRRFLRHFVTA